MKTNKYKDVGTHRVEEIFNEGWNQIEFIEAVFKEWIKLNQTILNELYMKVTGTDRCEGDLDKFSLWLVDNIYLPIYCNSSDNIIVKEFCIKHFGYSNGNIQNNQLIQFLCYILTNN